MSRIEGRKKNTYSILEWEESDDGRAIKQGELRMDVELFGKSLPKELAEIFYLFDKGYNQEEIAEIIGCSQQNVSYQIKKIRDIAKRFFS